MECLRGGGLSHVRIKVQHYRREATREKRVFALSRAVKELAGQKNTDDLH
jgi:hypothetical protein